MTDPNNSKGLATEELEKAARENTIPLDDAILEAQGHKPELDRSLSWLGATGLAFSISNSWIGYATTFGVILSYGGGQTALFGVIASAVTQWIVLLGLAELSSALPSSGGHYHFAYFLSPKSTRNFAAFTIGIFNLIAWWVSSASSLLYTTLSAFGIVVFCKPDFMPQQWHIYLGYVLMIILTLIPNFLVSKNKMDYMNKTTLSLSLIGFFMVVLVLLVMGRGNYQPQHLTAYYNYSGWSSGPAWLLSISMGEYCFTAAGSIVHLAEEMPQPGRTLPRVINMTTVIGILTVIPWVIVMLCGVHDAEAISYAWLPTLEVFYQATGSKAVAAFLQAYLTLLYYTCIPAQWTTCSRIAWSFSRDNGLPFSKYWNHIDPNYNFPVRTTLLSAGFCLLYGVVYIASTAAFSSIVNMSVLLINLAYTAPQGILAFGRRHKLPARHFSLGRFGYAVNIISVLWLIVSGVMFCFPMTNPTMALSMNYGSVFIVGTFLAVLLMYVERRGKFCGPKIDRQALNENNHMSS